MERHEIVAMDKSALTGDIVRPLLPNHNSGGGYEEALHAAGVDVLAYESFGNHQGDWWARVRFPNGEIAFVRGYYGSCSGCDAFEGEFGWNAPDQPDFLHRLAQFGRGYLEECYTLEQALEEAGRDTSWDVDAQEVVDWLKAHAM